MEVKTAHGGAGAGPDGTADATPEPGLRERKKEQTRKRIAKAALELSEQNGFAATTISEIAKAADVSPRTVFGYFPSKEATIFAGTEEMLDGLEARLTQRPEQERVTEALRAWLLEVVGSQDEKESELANRRRALIDSELALRAHERHLMARGESIIAAAAAGEIGRAPDEMLPNMVGAATIAALDAIGRTMKDCSRDEALGLIDGYIDDLVDFIAGGIAALQRS